MKQTDVSDVVIRPGQLWSWEFTVNKGWWPFEMVTEARRSSHFSVSSNVVMMERGDRFLIISTDDPGPGRLPGADVPQFDEHGTVIPGGMPWKRWHVALAHGKLFWISHDFFDHARLVSDEDDDNGLCADISARGECIR